jgi:cytoskeletal protein CcmA (bactofilin family)
MYGLKQNIRANILSADIATRVHDCTAHGIITSDNFTYYDGVFVGDIKISNKLIIGEHAYIQGNIYAIEVIVLGKIIGDLFIEESASFESSAVFTGNLISQRIEIREGAKFNAHCECIPLNKEITEGISQAKENINELSISDVLSSIDNKSFISKATK